MKAVNLIPSETRRVRVSGPAIGKLGAAHVLLALLAVAVAFVTIDVLTSNTIANRKAQIASLQTEVAQVQAEASHLANYVAFEQLATARAATVREIASARFDWHAALTDLARVVPSYSSIQSLFGTVAPGATISGATGSSGGSGITAALRGAISSPAFELTGCARTQDDVARLMSRLRLTNGVTRVTLSDAIKQQSSAPAASGSAGSSSTSGSSSTGDCAHSKYDMVVFFSPLPNAGPDGVTSVSASTSTGATP
jgi:Tfp pilus assembly protein PilN